MRNYSTDIEVFLCTCRKISPKIKKNLTSWKVTKGGGYCFFSEGQEGTEQFFLPFLLFLPAFAFFSGRFQIFFGQQTLWGSPQINFNFGLFHFLLIFGHFLAVFAFLGHFCIFKWF